MAFRSNDGFNLALKGNSLQPAANISSRSSSSARNNSQSKQPVTPSRTGDFKESNIYIIIIDFF
jgi:hypothetical protein